MSRTAHPRRDWSVTADGRRWLPLLGRLQEAVPEAVVWKNAGDALGGTGDVDLAVPVERWAAVLEEFRPWAEAVTPHPVVVCRHLPFAMLAVAVDRDEPSLLQLDVRDRVTFRGSTLFRATTLSPLIEMDVLGFRRLRPGAEGLLKLVLKGLGLGGRPKWERLRKEKVAELVRADPAGAARTAGLLGIPPLVRGVAALAEGRWDRLAMARAELRLVARAAFEPATARARLRFRMRSEACPVVRATMRHGRRVPQPVDAWIASARRHHLEGREP